MPQRITAFGDSHIRRGSRWQRSNKKVKWRTALCVVGQRNTRVLCYVHTFECVGAHNNNAVTTKFIANVHLRWYTMFTCQCTRVFPCTVCYPHNTLVLLWIWQIFRWWSSYWLLVKSVVKFTKQTKSNYRLIIKNRKVLFHRSEIGFR